MNQKVTRAIQEKTRGYKNYESRDFTGESKKLRLCETRSPNDEIVKHIQTEELTENKELDLFVFNLCKQKKPKNHYYRK